MRSKKEYGIAGDVTAVFFFVHPETKHTQIMLLTQKNPLVFKGFQARGFCDTDPNLIRFSPQYILPLSPSQVTTQQHNIISFSAMYTSWMTSLLILVGFWCSIQVSEKNLSIFVQSPVSILPILALKKFARHFLLLPFSSFQPGIFFVPIRRLGVF